MDLGSPITTQAVAARLLGTLDEVRALRRQQLKPRRDLLASLLSERLPTGRSVSPHGGLFLWVKLPSDDAREFAQFAARHGVVTLPGSTLSADESHTAFLRMPFLAEPETLRRGVDRLATAWRGHSLSRPGEEAPESCGVSVISDTCCVTLPTHVRLPLPGL